MKKISAILVCLLLVASLAVTAFAADTVEITVTPAKTTVSRGEVVDFSVTMSELADCRSGGMALKAFNTEVFEYVEGSGKCHLEGTKLGQFQVVAGIVSGSFMFENATTVSGKIFSFQLKVKDTAPLGETTIECSGSARTTAGAATTTINNVTMTVACAHEWGAWTSDAENHSRTCTKCGEVETGAHTAGQLNHDATNHWNECVCGYHVNEAAHTPAATWSTDESNHWHACECGNQADFGAHNWDEGVVTVEPTDKTEGLKVFTCQTCQATKEVSIPKIGDDAMGDTSMILPFVLLMVLSAAGVAVTVVSKKRAAR